MHMLDLANVVEPISVMELHCWLGHIAVLSAQKLVESGAIIRVNLDPSSEGGDCDACIFAHATHLPVPKVQISTPTQNFGDKVHTNVWGPMTIATHQGHQYFITFTDNATCYMITFLLCTKDEALEAYKLYEAWATMQQHCKAIKVLHSDHRGEYLSTTFDQHLAKAGTVQKLTMHDTPQLNGLTEHLNHTLLECIQAFMHVSGLLKSLWGEVLQHTTWLKNQMAICALDSKTPFAALYGQPPDLSALCMWGTVVWVHNAAGSKLDVCVHKVHWLSLDVNARAHCIFWPGLGNVMVEHNVYSGLTVLLEGEQKLSIANSKQTAAPSISISAPPPDLPEVPSTTA